MNEWIDVEKELPPHDGDYRVTNNIDTLNDLSILYYDGIGFMYNDIYRPVKYWRYYEPMKKRYGKVE